MELYISRTGGTKIHIISRETRIEDICGARVRQEQDSKHLLNRVLLGSN